MIHTSWFHFLWFVLNLLPRNNLNTLFKRLALKHLVKTKLSPYMSIKHKRAVLGWKMSTRSHAFTRRSRYATLCGSHHIHPRYMASVHCAQTRQVDGWGGPNISGGLTDRSILKRHVDLFINWFVRRRALDPSHVAGDLANLFRAAAPAADPGSAERLQLH